MKSQQELLDQIFKIVPDRYLDIHHRLYNIDPSLRWRAETNWKIGRGGTIEQALKNLLEELKK